MPFGPFQLILTVRTRLRFKGLLRWEMAKLASRLEKSRAAKRGGFQTGRFPDLDLSFLVTFTEALFPPSRLDLVQVMFSFWTSTPWANLCLQACPPNPQGPLNGGFQTGGFLDLNLSFLFCPFWDFPDFFGIFPICPGTLRGFSRFVLFLFLSLLTAPMKNSPERVRDTIWTFPEKSGKPPGLASLKKDLPFSLPIQEVASAQRVFSGYF